MKRRNFLGMALASPVAAKAAAAEMAGVGAGSNALGNLPELPERVFNANPAPPSLGYGDWIADEIAGLVKRMACVEDDIRDDQLGLEVRRLDPDLAASRSLSLSTKMRLQAERNFKREVESRRSSLRRRLEALKRDHPTLAAIAGALS